MPNQNYKSPSHEIETFFKSSPGKQSHGKSNLYQSVFISRKLLLAIRILAALYFGLSSLVVIGRTKNPLELLHISKWSFLIETIYFLFAAKQSLIGKAANREREEEIDCELLHMLYEIAFSFQFRNLICFLGTVVVEKELWRDPSVEMIFEAQFHVLSFIIIWCDQLFNLMKFYKKHILLIMLISVGNLCLELMIETLKNLIPGSIAHDGNGPVIGILFAILPIAHFLIGFFHYEYKVKTKNNKRKLLVEQLVSLMKVPVGVTYVN